MSWKSILQRQQEWTKDKANEYRLSVEEATELYSNAPLHELTIAADKRRKSFFPSGEVTYLVDRNVNYTNVCTINCQFCSFYRPPGHDENYLKAPFNSDLLYYFDQYSSYFSRALSHLDPAA